MRNGSQDGLRYKLVTQRLRPAVPQSFQPANTAPGLVHLSKIHFGNPGIHGTEGVRVAYRRDYL